MEWNPARNMSGLSAGRVDIFPRLYFKIESNEPLDDFRISREFYDEVIAELSKIRPGDRNTKDNIPIPYRLEIKSGSIEIILSILAQAFQELDKYSFIRDIGSAVVTAAIVAKAKTWFERNKKNIKEARMNSQSIFALELQKLINEHSGRKPNSIKYESGTYKVAFEDGADSKIIDVSYSIYQAGKETTVPRVANKTNFDDASVLKKRQSNLLEEIYNNERMVEGHERWEEDGGGGSGKGKEEAWENIRRLKMELDSVNSQLKRINAETVSDEKITGTQLQMILNERADLLNEVNSRKQALEGAYRQGESDLPSESQEDMQEGLRKELDEARARLSDLDKKIRAIIPEINLEKELEFPRAG